MRSLATRFDNRFTTVIAAAAVIGLVGAGAGYAANTIGSGDIVDNSVKSKDIKNETIKLKDIKDKAEAKLKGQTGPAGPAGPAGPSGTATYAGPNWSIVDRNVIKNGDSYLRSGPATPPSGIGSLGMRTGQGGDPAVADKAAFGNQVDFVGLPLSGINTVKYSVYTTGENNTAGGSSVNAPSVAFEIDPTGPTDATAPNFTTLVYVPTGPLAANQWTNLDGSTAAQWYLTGTAGTASGCNQTTYCTLTQVKAFYPSASLLTAQFTKGRDFFFSGAVDALIINADKYDFEPFGVTKSAA